MKKIFIAIALIFLKLNPIYGNQEKLLPYLLSLKARQPNWRFEAVKYYPHGTPHTVMFYEPTVDGERPVQQTIFYENNRVQTQMDVALVDDPSKAAQDWESRIIQDGARLDFSLEGALLQYTNYDLGRLDGKCVVFYPSGQIQSEKTYGDGNLVGEAKSYYEDGKIKEEAYYENGLLDGEVVQYHQNGSKAGIFPHRAGKLHGTALNWFPTGVLNVQRTFDNGEFNTHTKNPALILYN